MTTAVTISLPEHLVERATEAAKAAGESLDTYIAHALAGELERERTDRFFAERRARGDIARALEILERPSAEPPNRATSCQRVTAVPAKPEPSPAAPSD